MNTRRHILMASITAAALAGLGRTASAAGEVLRVGTDATFPPPPGPWFSGKNSGAVSLLRQPFRSAWFLLLRRMLAWRLDSGM